VSELSVVIVARDARERLRGCLEALKHALPLSSEVIVVDDASSDATARMVASEFGHVRLVRSDQAVGHVASVERGVRMARGAYLMLLDPSVHLYPNAAREMVDFLEQNLRHGAVVPRIVRPDGTTVAPHRRHPTLKTALWLGTPLERWKPEAPELGEIFACDFDYAFENDVEETSTACLVMRRRALKRTETLDAALYPHFHEADLCMRVREAGWRLGYLPDTVAMDVDGVAERGYPDLSPEWHAQRLLWYRKHLGQSAGWWVKACVGWTVSVRLGKEMRRRINGLREEPIVPVWREYAGLLKI
jgi:GT2 family glycosyltransferase